MCMDSFDKSVIDCMNKREDISCRNFTDGLWQAIAFLYFNNSVNLFQH